MPDLQKPAPSTGESTTGDWPAQATDAIVGLVDSVKDKVNGPATSIARGIVYGTLAALVGTAALALALALVVRGLDILAQVVLDGVGLERFGRATWIAHLVTGLLCLVPGVLLWRKGTHPPAAG